MGFLVIAMIAIMLIRAETRMSNMNYFFVIYWSLKIGEDNETLSECDHSG